MCSENRVQKIGQGHSEDDEFVPPDVKILQDKKQFFPNDSEFWRDPKLIENCKKQPILRTREPPKAGVRCIIDFKYVNMALKPQKICTWPIQPCKHIIDRLQGKKYCSQLDVVNAFWSFECDPISEKIQTFSFDALKFSPKRLCHGITTAAGAFQRQMYKILLKNGLQDHVSNHIDNMIVATDTIEQHYIILEKLFQAIKKSGLKLHYYKQFLAHNGMVTIFGWQIDLKTSQVGPCPKKFLQIEKFPVPKTTKACRSYCGLWNFYSSLVPNLGQILSPLYEKCSGAKKFVWDTEAQKSWEESQKLVKKQFLLSLPDYNKRFFLLVDAARKQGYSCSVFQRNNNDELRGINHSSKIFKGAQKNYSQFKSEFFALKQGLQHNIQYFGIAHPEGHIVFTDTQALQYAVRYSWESSQLFRWSNFVFSLPIRILPLSANTNLIHWADMNSRPLQAHKQARHEIDKFQDKKYDPNEDRFLDFSGLGEIPIQQFFRVMQNFQKYVSKMDAVEIRKKWNLFKSEQLKVAQIRTMNRDCVIKQIDGEMDFPITTYIGPHPIQIYQDKDFCLKAEMIDLERANLSSQNRCYQEIQNIISVYLTPLNMQKINIHQQKDAKIDRIRTEIKFPYLEIKGLVFKKINSIQYIILWPKVLNNILIKTFHTFSSQIHIKKKKLRQFLEQNFDIQDINKEINIILENCEYCLRNNPTPQRKAKIAGPTFMIKAPFQYFSFDYVTICSTWKKYGDVLSLVDNFSGATFYFPCSANMSEQELINFWFQNVFAHIGHMRALCSDGQSQLIGRTFSILCKILNIKRYIATHASQNLSEARNGALLKFLKSIHHRNPIKEIDMPILMSTCTLLFNTLPIGPHFCAPAKIMANFGPFSPKMAKMTQIPDISRENYPEYLIRLQQLKVTCNLIQNRMKQKYEKGQDKQRFHNFKAFDFVLLKKPTRPGPLHKLQCQYYKDCFFILKIFAKSALILNYTKFIGHKKILHRRAPGPRNAQRLLVHVAKLKKIKNPLEYLNLPISDGDFRNLIKDLENQAGLTIKEASLVNQTERVKLTKNQQKIKNFLDLPLQKELNLSEIQIREAKYQEKSYRLFCHLVSCPENERKTLVTKYKNSGIFRFTCGNKITEFSLQNSKSLNEDLLESQWSDTVKFREFQRANSKERKKIHFERFCRNQKKSFTPCSDMKKFTQDSEVQEFQVDEKIKLKRKKRIGIPFQEIASPNGKLWGGARTFRNIDALENMTFTFSENTSTRVGSSYHSIESNSQQSAEESEIVLNSVAGSTHQIRSDDSDQSWKSGRTNYDQGSDEGASVGHVDMGAVANTKGNTNTDTNSATNTKGNTNTDTNSATNTNKNEGTNLNVENNIIKGDNTDIRNTNTDADEVQTEHDDTNMETNMNTKINTNTNTDIGVTNTKTNTKGKNGHSTESQVESRQISCKPKEIPIMQNQRRTSLRSLNQGKTTDSMYPDLESMKGRKPKISIKTKSLVTKTNSQKRENEKSKLSEESLCQLNVPPNANDQQKVSDDKSVSRKSVKIVVKSRAKSSIKDISRLSKRSK